MPGNPSSLRTPICNSAPAIFPRLEGRLQDIPSIPGPRAPSRGRPLVRRAVGRDGRADQTGRNARVAAGATFPDFRFRGFSRMITPPLVRARLFNLLHPRLLDVRSSPDSRHVGTAAACPLCARDRHSPLFDSAQTSRVGSAGVCSAALDPCQTRRPEKRPIGCSGGGG